MRRERPEPPSLALLAAGGRALGFARAGWRNSAEAWASIAIRREGRAHRPQRSDSTPGRQ
jgi:hypothetical protein